MYSHISILVTGSTSTLARHGAMKVANHTKVSPYSPKSKPQRRDHTPLSGVPEGGDRNLYTKVAASSTT
jgi:hypothetical protein